MTKFNFILVTVGVLLVVRVNCGDSNATSGTENVTTILPPAMAAPRLRPSYEVIETNLTDIDPANETITRKNNANFTQITRESVDESKQQSKTSTTPPPRNYTNYVSSSTAPALNYVTIGGGSAAIFKASSSSHNGDDVDPSNDDGFKPFVPSRPFVENTVDAVSKPAASFKYNDDDEDDEYAKYATTNFKSNSPPVNYEIYSPPDYGPYSTYRTIVTGSNRIRGEPSTTLDYEPLLSSAKFHDDDDRFGAAVSYSTTTFTPAPKINPMRRPISIFKPKKTKPTKNLGYGDYDWSSWRLRDYALRNNYGKAPALQFDYGVGGGLSELIDESHSFDDTFNGGAGVLNKPAYSNKPPRKNGLLHILATLIPIGLLLSALPPRVIFINSTNPIQQQKPFFRNLEKELSRINDGNDTAAYNLVVNIGLQPSTDPVCNKRKICQVALNGTKTENSFVESGLWHLLSRSSDVIRTKLNLQDVYEAVKSKHCYKFTCYEESTARGEPSNEHVLSPATTQSTSAIAFSTRSFYREPQ